MVEVLRTSVVRANKPYQCSYCCMPIAKGEKYRRSCNKYDGELYTWRSHLHCAEIASAIWDFADPDPGMDECTFRDCVRQVMSELYCPANCPKWDEDDGCAEFSWTTCLRKFAEHLKTHELRQCMADSGIRVWRLVPRDTTRGEPR